MAGVGEAMTLRFTSPQAARVVASASLMAFIIGPEAGLDDAVKLEALARGDAQRVVAVLGREAVESQIMLRLDDTARQTAAHHENVLLGDLALVPVILLINAVKFQKFVVILGKTVHRGIGQSGANGAGEGRARLLKSFIARQFCRVRRC